MMWDDPIVKETRRLREEYASRFNHDPDAIFEDILRRQENSKRKCVSLPPRKPELEKDSVETLGRVDCFSGASPQEDRLPGD
jgi:hypothetical protein